MRAPTCDYMQNRGIEDSGVTPDKKFYKKYSGNPCVTPYTVGGLCVPKARGTPGGKPRPG